VVNICPHAASDDPFLFEKHLGALYNLGRT
jgi:hypothetical protein